MPTSQSRSSAADALDALDASRTVAELERAFLSVAPRLLHADGYGICWLNSEQRTQTARSIGVPDGLVEDYEHLGRDNDALFGHMASRNEPVHDRVLFDQRAWDRQPVRHFLSDWGFGRGMQAPVYVHGALRTSLHFVRAPAARPFSDRDLRAAELLRRRVGHQLRCLVTARELDRTRRMCVSLIEQISVPAVITSVAAELVQVNRAADLMLVSYRAKPALWPDYAAAVSANVAALEAGGAGDDGRHAARGDGDDAGFIVRTSRVDRDELFLSLFHPPRPKLPALSTLRPREQVIARLVAEGHTNDRIATMLNLSVNTVKAHLKRINRTLGTANRAQVAAWAQEMLAASPRPGAAP